MRAKRVPKRRRTHHPRAWWIVCGYLGNRALDACMIRRAADLQLVASDPGDEAGARTPARTDSSPHPASCCSSLQPRSVLVAASFSLLQLVAATQPGLLIPRSQVRSLPGPSKHRAKRNFLRSRPARRFKRPQTRSWSSSSRSCPYCRSRIVAAHQASASRAALRAHASAD